MTLHEYRNVRPKLHIRSLQPSYATPLPSDSNGIGHAVIHGYTEEAATRKEQFLRDGRLFCSAVASCLALGGYTHVDIRQNSSGIAGSGEVYATFAATEELPRIAVCLEEDVGGGPTQFSLWRLAAILNRDAVGPNACRIPFVEHQAQQRGDALTLRANARTLLPNGREHNGPNVWLPIPPTSVLAAIWLLTFVIEDGVRAQRLADALGAPTGYTKQLSLF